MIPRPFLLVVWCRRMIVLWIVVERGDVALAAAVVIKGVVVVDVVDDDEADAQN